MAECIFKTVQKCRGGGASGQMSSTGERRIRTIIQYSKTYDDGLHKTLQEQLDKNPQLTLTVHRNCVSSYCSAQHCRETLRRKGGADAAGVPSPAKRRRRSGTPNFDFQRHCIFCGVECNIHKDIKNPGRWRRAFLCRQLGANYNFKHDIVEICNKRAGDKLAEEVRVRVEGAVSDLHAADARYHVDCKSNFMSRTGVFAVPTATSSSTNMDIDINLEYVVNLMRVDKSRIWNSVELFEVYSNETNGNYSRRLLMQKLRERFGDDLLILSANGVASIVVFKSMAPGLLKIVSDFDDSGIDISIEKLTKAIIQEVKAINISKKQYSSRLSDEVLQDSVSDTVMSFLSKLSSKLDHSLESYLIGSIITCAITNFPTMLQIGLGVLMRSSKALINQMYSFGVTCSYDEVLRFKKSAALAATSSASLQGISCASEGLIQTVVDNFDADISSQNGKLSTHSLAVLLTQPNGPDTNTKGQNVIRRVELSEMKETIDFNFPMEHYNGPKKPQMPPDKVRKTVLSLKMLASIAVSKARAETIDAAFLRDVVNSDDCPEFNGYNTRQSRQQGHSAKPSTKAVYMPLIDMTPSDPDTIMTSLRQSQTLTVKCGQEYAVFTGDLQLYRVAVNVIWAYPEQFGNVVLRLGGMHTLMSYVGSIGTLMADSGLSEILESTFGGVAKMLSGKKFPQNVRALRILTEELLRTHFEDSVNDMKTLEDILSNVARESKTSKLWINCLVKGVLIMMMFIRAERECDWCLHLAAMKAMIPYFFAAGHVNYARYGLYYLRSMESLPTAVQEKFIKGEHVMRHVPGLWNGIWSDMYIETTFMRYGHGATGIIGITLKPETLKVWALSLHICSQIEQDLELLGDEDRPQEIGKHKEEMKGRKSADMKDRISIKKKIDECIHPLRPAEHPPELVNVVTGKVAPPTVNVENAIEIGSKQMTEFENGWPESFNETISRSVTTQTASKKSVKIGDARSFDTELIYTRVIGLQASSREVDLKEVLSYELSPVPTSMFTESGDLRIAKSKSQLKKILQSETSARQSSKQIESVVIDGSAILYIIRWPANGTVMDYITQFRRFIERKLVQYNVYVVFDRYRHFSTKGETRVARGATSCRIHQLSTVMQLPPQKAILTVPENKKQLIALICDDLSMNTSFPNEATGIQHKLVITGEDEVPLEVTVCVKIRREDMRTTHEEADNILAQQMVLVANETNRGVSIIADDTDVFVLAIYHFMVHQVSVQVIMESPIQDRAVIDINATVDANKDIIHDLPAAHALSGCDTVACCHGIGKGTAVKVLKSGKCPITAVGDDSANQEDVVRESTAFVASCYGINGKNTMSEVRIAAWAKKVGKSPASAPKIHSLPPTTESFSENVKRAHFQACVWKHAVDPDPPELDPVDYGWTKNEEMKSLSPVMVPVDVQMAPPEILKLIRCSCESQMPCSNMRCRCNSARLSCTVFCACRGEDMCCNEQNKSSNK